MEYITRYVGGVQQKYTQSGGAQRCSCFPPPLEPLSLTPLKLSVPLKISPLEPLYLKKPSYSVPHMLPLREPLSLMVKERQG